MRRTGGVSQPGKRTRDVSRAPERGEKRQRVWRTGRRARKGDGSPRRCRVHPCRYWHRRTRNMK
eukprot:401644-Pyramimonas_sp.AAC.1